MLKSAAKLVAVTTMTLPETGAPDPARLLSGTPQHRTWNAHETPDGAFFAGIWESDAGSWAIEYTEAEFCHILEGESRLTDADGHVTTVRAGDAFVIPAGFSGTWEVVSRTRKHYAIYNPPAIQQTHQLKD
ncbi:MAG: cupin domain-containing protein [Parvibaculaceae bacterium]